jgi:isoleucyl-tRNA synthetase
MADKWDTLKMISIVSELAHAETLEGEVYSSEEIEELQVAVSPATGDKCERCWLRSETVGDNSDHPELCGRCSGVMLELG